MKKSAIIILLILSAISLFAEDNLSLFRQYYRNKAYQEAYELLPNLVNQKYKDEMIYLAFGDVYFEMEKYDSARIMYQYAYDIRDDREEIVVKLARAYSYTKDVSKAVKLLKDFLKKNNDSWLCNLELGYVYLRADSLKQAEYYIAKARDLNKKNAEPLVALGDLYFTQKVYELARMNYEDALAINPELTDARVKLATAYYWLANKEADENLSNELFTRSLKEWQIVSQKDPKNAKAWFEQGKILFLARRFEDAARAFYQFVQLRPTNALARWYLAQSLVEIGKCDSAVTHLEFVIKELDSVRTNAELKLARCYFDNQNFAKSLEVYNKIKSENQPLESRDYERIASCNLRLGDTTSALNVYEELLTKNTNECGLAYQVGMLAFVAKKYPEAIKFFAMSNQRCNDTIKAKANFFIGNSFLNINQPDSAIIYLSKSIELDSLNPLTYIYRGDAYSNANLKPKGKEDFQTAIKIINSNSTETNKRYLPAAYGKLCSLLFEQKDSKELLKVSKSWAEIEPNSENPWMYMAIAYQIQKDLPNACRSWKKVLQINSKNKIANEYYNQLKCGESQ